MWVGGANFYKSLFYGIFDPFLPKMFVKFMVKITCCVSNFSFSASPEVEFQILSYLLYSLVVLLLLSNTSLNSVFVGILFRFHKRVSTAFLVFRYLIDLSFYS